MRALRLIAAFLALALSPQMSWAASTGAFSIVCGSVTAGSDVACTVSRSSGGKGVYVLFQTSDGTAKAGTDYTAVSQLLYFRAGAVGQTVAVHTAVNPNATGTLTFTASIAAGTVVARTTGSIVEPAPPAPTPVPPPVPTNTWVSAPLRDGGYARCKAVGGCHSFAPPYPDIIAQQGDVMMYAWNGCDGAIPCRAIGAFWPIGQYKTSTPYIGVEGFVDEWEGVAPGSIVGSLVMRQGLVYRVVSTEPNQIITGTIVGVQYASDTTGHYYLANDPVLKAETQYFMGSDLTPAP